MLAFQLGQVRNRRGCGDEALQEREAVGAKTGVVGVDRHLVEEGVDHRPEPGHRGHGGGKVLGRQRPADGGLGVVEGGEQGALLVLLGELRVRRAGILDADVVAGEATGELLPALVVRREVGADDLPARPSERRAQPTRRP